MVKMFGALFSLYAYCKSSFHHHSKITPNKRKISIDQASIVRSRSKRSLSFSTEEDGSFTRQSTQNITEMHYLRSTVAANAEDQNDRIPKAASYEIPYHLKIDVSPLNDRISDLQKQQQEICQTVQKVCHELKVTRDELTDTQKQLRQLILHEKLLDIIMERLDDLNKKIV